MTETTPGEEVRLTRRARGLSQVQLAAKVGVDAGTIGRIERGVGEPTKLEMVQAYLRIGPYKDKRDNEGAFAGLDLTGAKVPELVAHLLDVATELNRRLPKDESPSFAEFSDIPRPNLREHLGKWTPEQERQER